MLLSQAWCLIFLPCSSNGPLTEPKSYKESEEGHCHYGTDKREKYHRYLCFIQGQRDERILGRLLAQLGCMCLEEWVSLKQEKK